MKVDIKKKLLLPSLCAVFVTLVACSDDDDDNSSDSSGSNGQLSQQQIQSTQTGIASAVPSTLALSAFPQSVDSTELTLQNTDEDMTVKEKIQEHKKRLTGQADRCFDPNLFQNRGGHSDVKCYDFDSDMNPAKFSDNPEQEWGTKDGKSSGGEACMVAFARSEIQDAVDTVDRALALVSGLICQAQKDDKGDLPAAGQTLDLASSFKKGAEDMPVKVATITRLDDIDGDPVYKTELQITDPNGIGTEVNLVHSPGGDGTSTGTLWFKREPEAAGGHEGGHDSNNTANKNAVMSINYNRSIDDDGNNRMKFEVRRAMIEKSYELFTDAGLVNYGALPDAAQNDDIHAIQYVAFDVDTDTNEGDLSYWMNPGGNINESARGFLFNIEASDNGTLTGCGVSGSTNGISIRGSLADPENKILAPTKYWHPRGDQNTHADKDSRYSGREGNSITEQCFRQGTDGQYDIDTDKTTHARGYEVIATGNSDVEPPARPKDHLKGDFKE